MPSASRVRRGGGPREEGEVAHPPVAPQCPAQVKEAIGHFVARRAMDGVKSRGRKDRPACSRRRSSPTSRASTACGSRTSPCPGFLGANVSSPRSGIEGVGAGAPLRPRIRHVGPRGKSSPGASDDGRPPVPATDTDGVSEILARNAQSSPGRWQARERPCASEGGRRPSMNEPEGAPAAAREAFVPTGTLPEQHDATEAIKTGGLTEKAFRKKTAAVVAGPRVEAGEGRGVGVRPRTTSTQRSEASRERGPPAGSRSSPSSSTTEHAGSRKAMALTLATDGRRVESSATPTPRCSRAVEDPSSAAS